MTEATKSVETARDLMMRVLRNAGYLICGKSAGGLMSLAYLALAARALGPAEFGVLVLAQTYVMTAAGLSRFQSWQAVISFGARFCETGDLPALRHLIGFTAMLDLLSALICAIGARLAAPHVGAWLGWPEEAFAPIYIYCFVAPFLIAATPTGVLRLLGRFRLLGAQLALMPMIRLIGAAALLAGGGGLTAFLAVWIVSAFIHGASLWALGARAARRAGFFAGWDVSAAAALRGRPGWWLFALKTNIASSINMVTGHVAVLIIGGVAGPAAAGFYRLGANIANVLAKPASLLGQSVYPELARMAARADMRGLRRAALHGGAMAGGISLAVLAVLILGGESIVRLFAGEGYERAAPVMALVAGAGAIRMFGFAFGPALMALDRAGAELLCKLAMGILHLGGLWALLPVLGLEGAGLALIASVTLLRALEAAVLLRVSAPKRVEHTDDSI